MCGQKLLRKDNGCYGGKSSAVFFLSLFLFSVVTLAADEIDRSELIREYNTAWRLLYKQEYDKAISMVQRIATKDPTFPDPYYFLETYVYKNPDQAEAYFKSLLEHDGQNPLVWYGLGWASYKKQNCREAIAYSKRCIETRPGLIGCYDMFVGCGLDQKEEIEDLIQYLTEIISTNPGNPGPHYGLGRLYIVFQGNQEAGLQAYLTGLERARKIKDRETEVMFLEALGTTYSDLYKYQNAIECFEDSVRIAQDLGYEGIAFSLIRIGGLYSTLGSYSHALKYQQQALEVSWKLGDRDNEARALRGISNIHLELGNYSKALDYNQNEIKLLLDLGDKTSRHRAGASMGNTAIIYQSLGDYEKALGYYEKSLQSARKFQDKGEEERNLSNIGDLCIQMGKYREAREHLEQSLKIAEEIKNNYFKGGSLISLGEVHKRLGQYEKALEYFKEGMKVLKERGYKYQQGNGLISLGKLYLSMNQPDEAITYFNSALEIGKETGALETIWNAHSRLGSALEQKGEYQKAFDHYESAIETVEKIRSQIPLPDQKSSFLENKLNVYERAINLLARRNDKDRAFEYAERGKARAFLELLVESKAHVEEGIEQALLETKRRLEATLSDRQRRLSADLIRTAGPSGSVTRAAKQEELQQAQREFDEENEKLQREIRRRNPKYADLYYPQPINLAQVQKLLDDDSVLMEYTVGEKSAFLFAITNKEYQLYRLGNTDRLHAQVKGLRDLIMKTEPIEQVLGNYAGEYAGLAYKLYRMLVGPAEKLLVNKKRLIIVPDGVLVYLPFEALLLGKRVRDADFAQLPYLIKKYSIHYVPSATVLSTLKAPREKTTVKQKEFLAFADPVYNEGKQKADDVRGSFTRGVVRGKLGRLIHSGPEARAIAKVFPPGESKLFLRPKASEENVKTGVNLQEYKKILFSAHGLLNEEKPQFSAIVLTPGNGSQEDGFLQVHEIFNLKMNAELVVLSACQTALGKQVRGEGLIGLTRAFMYAGTPSVVASLWKVSDTSTSVLMPRFFRKLHTTRGVDKADALQQAKRWMIQSGQYSHPFYWAAFVLIGER
jgi:CHAT domain-containing protein/uncharacterized protein HemY